MNLYGQDMDEDMTPWEAGLAWTVALDEGRDFIGRAALEKQKADGVQAHAGRASDGRQGRAAPRPARRARRRARARFCPAAFSPTLGKSIAFARVPTGAHGTLQADIRGKLVPVRVVKYPFVRDGKAQEGM